MRLAVLLVGLMVTGAVPASIQDLLRLAPDAATVEYEDSRVRVVRLRIAPNGSLPMHDRPARVVVSLTPNHARLTSPDGTSSVTRTETGRVVWSEPTRRQVSNLAAAALENIIIEIKRTDGTAAALARPAAPPPPDYLAEPLHRWRFENQYVRAYDVRIPPGATTAFHRHGYDAVVIFVSGGSVEAQTQGEPWGRLENRAAGSVRFSPDSNQPFTHRVRNAGAHDFHVVLVQLLR